MSTVEKITFGSLYQQYLDKNYSVIVRDSGHEVIDVSADNIKTLTLGNRYVKILYLSRHKTSKHLIKISIDSGDDVTVTTDHVCMKFNRDHFFENTNAKNLSVHDTVSVYDEKNDREIFGTITKIEDIGPTDDYVYDLEVDDDQHVFYANNVLVHNSQFINLKPVTDYMRNKYGLGQKIREWPEEKQWELWNTMQDFVDNDVNKYVRNLVATTCKTSQANVLTYELEYLADVGLYESKKHYFIRKLFEEGSLVDKIKVTGIVLKKNETDKSVKNFLEEIYRGAVIDGWTVNDYADYVYDLYQKFKKMDIEQIGFWKGYGTARESVGFLKMAVGTTLISRACTYYNQLIEKLGLGKKYDQLRVGDKCRLIYIKPNNKYGINCIAYKPGQWPKEFDKIFQIDYDVMFDKIVLDQLKRFREACKFDDVDPKKQVVQDIFDL